VDLPPAIELKHNRMVFQIRSGTEDDKKKELIDGWYRELVRGAVLPLFASWEQKIGVKANGVAVRRMKTKWGSCNPTAKTILLNTDLAKEPRECLEYIVVHELVHFLEPTHNEQFIKLMDQHMPKWQSHRQLLNSLPVRHENWKY
jgi:predicted metal-dependent hydrolase